MQIQKGKSTRRELSTFTVTCENMKLVLGLFKVKHNGSQNCCFISYLHYTVSYIVCSTRFEVFQYSKRKNIRKIKEQIKKPIKFGQILSQSIVLRKGALPLNTPAVEGQGNLHCPPQTSHMHLACFACIRLAMLALTNPQIIFLYYPW